MKKNAMQTHEQEQARATQEAVRADLGAPARLGRRSFLRGALMGLAGMGLGVQLSGCAESSSRNADTEVAYTPIRLTSPPPAVPPAATQTIPSTAVQTVPTSTSSGSDNGSKVLLVYFSRAGENYFYGGRTQLAVGNTEVLAGMISPLIGCDVHRIEAVDPYPDDYEETRERNVREQNADARPAIANPLNSIEPYDIVLLGSPIWNVRAPMIMTTFVEGFDFNDKTVIPFVTYAVSGFGTTVRDYTASCPGATIGEGLAVRGEEVRDAGAAVDGWLRRINLLT